MAGYSKSYILVLAAFFCAALIHVGCYQKNPAFGDDAGLDAGTDTDADADSDADTDSDSDTDTDTDTDSDSDTDADTDTDTDSDSDTDPCVDVDCSDHGDCEVVDGGPVCDCDEGWFNSPNPADCGRPEIEINVDAGELYEDGGIFDFAEMEVDGDGNLASTYKAFTVKNIGTADLTIEDVYFEESDGGTADFDLDDTSESPVGPGDETSFTVRFDPQRLGDKSAFLTIANNDEDESEYTFQVTGAGVDTTPPSHTSGAITVSDVQENSITLSWTKAEDFVTPSEKLKYGVFLSTAYNIDTVENIETNGIQQGDWLEYTSQFEVTGLVRYTVYYFNVIVADESGNKRAYAMTSKKTTGPVLLYSVALSDPAMGGRAQANSFCSNGRPGHIPSLSEVVALITVSEADEIQDLPDPPYYVPTDREIRGRASNGSEYVFAANWTTLFTDGPAMSLADAAVLPASTSWASGSLTDGSTSEHTCDGWTASDSTSWTSGNSDYTDACWIQCKTQINCDSSSPTKLLCVTWE